MSRREFDPRPDLARIFDTRGSASIVFGSFLRRGNSTNPVKARGDLQKGEWKCRCNWIDYSWIGHGLQSAPTLAFSLWLSDFKTKTSFGFLVKKTGVVFF